MLYGWYMTFFAEAIEEKSWRDDETHEAVIDLGEIWHVAVTIDQNNTNRDFLNPLLSFLRSMPIESLLALST